MKPVTTDRVQRMIDAEVAERFPPDAAPRLALLHYGDLPVIEPEELYLRVILGQNGMTRDVWMEEYFDRLADFRAQRLPEVKGFIIATDTPGAGLRLNAIMKMDGISMLDPDDDEIARGLTPVTALLGAADLATLDTLITEGIAASRSEAARWALARVREQSAYARLSEQTREPQPRPGLDQTALDQLRSTFNERVKELFPDGEVRRVALPHHGDDPSIEPGDLVVRVFIEEAADKPFLPAWHRDHETMIRELEREIAAKLPGASHLEFWFGEDGRQGKRSHLLRHPSDDPPGRQRDHTPAHINLSPIDLAMLDVLITTGTAASRTEAVGWVLARIRERPAFARLSERARELDELKVHF
jgi:hypothetical protein